MKEVNDLQIIGIVFDFNFLFSLAKNHKES